VAEVAKEHDALLIADEMITGFGRTGRHWGVDHSGIRPDIVTICVGQAASMAAVLLAAGTKGKRFSLPNSRIMIHQPSMQGLAGQAADIDIYAKEILRMREILNKILSDASGQSIERVNRDVDRDYIMSSDQAVEYGIIDRVISSRELAPGPISKPA